MNFDTFDSPSSSQIEQTQRVRERKRERERGSQIVCGRWWEGGGGMLERTRTITKAKST